MEQQPLETLSGKFAEIPDEFFFKSRKDHSDIFSANHDQLTVNTECDSKNSSLSAESKTQKHGYSSIFTKVRNRNCVEYK